MKILKILGGGFVLVLALVQMSGCVGTIVVAPAPHCVIEPVEVCHTFRDYWGYWHRECRIENRERCWAVASVLGAPVGAVALGQTYGVGFDAAERLIQVAMDINQGKFDSAIALGLGQADLQAMASYNLPTDAGIEAVARGLNQDPAAIRQLFSGILTESRQNHDAVNKAAN